MKKYLLVAVLIVVAFLIYTRVDQRPADLISTEPTNLAPNDATYAMVLFNDGTGMRDVSAKSYTLRLVDNTLNGKICNSFNGTYSLSTDAILTAAQVVSTKMMCEPDVMVVEDTLFASLAKGVDMRTDGQDITFTSGTNVFVFKPIGDVSAE